jgi:hypothetical protein
VRISHLFLTVLIAAPGLVCADQASSNAPSTTSEAHLGLSVALGGEWGGSKLATGLFSDGTSANITAGRGVIIELGANYRPSKSSPWDISLMGGYKVNRVGGGSGGDLDFNHGVFELIGSYRWNNSVFVGAGPVYHTPANLTFAGFAPDVQFKGAAGGELQLGWKFVAVTYTFIRYPDDFGYVANGDSVGIRLIGNF